jgi:zinc protease
VTTPRSRAASSAALGLALCAACSAPAQAVRPAVPAPPPTATASPPPAPPAAPPARRPIPPPAPAPPAAAPPFAEATLPSGLRVVVVEHHRRAVLEVHLVLPHGALADPPGSAGATTMALRLAGEARERGATGDELWEEKSFRRQVMELGGVVQLDAAQDVSVIGFSGYPADARAYLALLADAVSRPRHGAAAFAAHRNALLDALEDLETSDPEALRRALRQAAFGPGDPYARSELGTLADLTRLGLEDVSAQQQRVFSPQGATLLLVGDVRAAAVLAETRKAFRAWTRPAVSSPVPAPAAAPRAGALPSPGGVLFLRRQPSSTLVTCAARPLGDVRASDAELALLAAILGRGARSRLMLALREEAGLTYFASAELIRNRRARAFLACAPLSAERSEAGVRLFRETFAALAAAPPSAEELARARALLLAEEEAALDDADGLARAWLEALALGQAAPRPEERRAALERVEAGDLQRLARALLRPGAVRWILSGDTAAATRAADAAGQGPLRPVMLGR